MEVSMSMILIFLLSLNPNLHPQPYVFTFDVVNTQTIAGQFSTMTGKTISVDWGEGLKVASGQFFFEAQ